MDCQTLYLNKYIADAFDINNGPIMKSIADEGIKRQTDAITAFYNKALDADGPIMTKVIADANAEGVAPSEFEAYILKKTGPGSDIDKQLTQQMTSQGLMDISSNYITDQVSQVMPTVVENASKQLCLDNNGNYLSDGSCTYKSKADCDASYVWPLGENDTYAEWSADRGACISASPAMRLTCDGNNIPYDSTTGICKIDENYCKMKGTEWKDGDCHVSIGQDIAETIFGSTVTRGLIQVFDPSQYEKCKDGETDDGYTCRSVGCDPGKEQNAGLCYDACKYGYTINGKLR
jgi:hypothetical protein